MPQRSISTNLKCDSVIISPPLALLSRQCKNTSLCETLDAFIGRGNLEGYTAHLRNNLFAESLELNALCSRMAPFCLIDILEEALCLCGDFGLLSQSHEFAISSTSRLSTILPLTMDLMSVFTCGLRFFQQLDFGTAQFRNSFMSNLHLLS